MMLYNEFKLVTSMIVCYQPILTKFKLKSLKKNFQSQKKNFPKKKFLSSDLKNV